MSGKIEISRELALLKEASEWIKANSFGGCDAVDLWERIDSAIAAPVVERQPVAYVLTRDEEVCYEADDGIVISNTPGDETNLYKWKPVYFDTLPPTPVAVPDGWRLVPLHPTMDMLDALMDWNKVGNVNAYNNILNAAPACLDKVKELNQ